MRARRLPFSAGTALRFWLLLTPALFFVVGAHHLNHVPHATTYFDAWELYDLSSTSKASLAPTYHYVVQDNDSSNPVIEINDTLGQKQEEYAQNQIASALTPTGPGGIDSDLILWLKADAGVTESSNDVSAWADQSSTGNNASQGTPANQPTYTSSSANYNPGITFDDAESHYLSLSAASLPSGTSARSYIFVATPVNVAARSFFEHGTVAVPQLFGTRFDETEISVEFNGHRIGISPSVISDQDLNLITYTLPSSPTSSQLTIHVDGTEYTSLSTLSGSNKTVNTGTTAAYIGANISLSGYFEGAINEIIVYEVELDSEDREAVQSYLALKYGIMLSHDYVDSDENVIWDATTNATYHNSVSGIGRDDDSGLNQKQSTSQSSGIVTMGLGTIATDNASNANTFSANGSFLLWGHDNGSSSVATSFTGTNVYSRMARIWMVEEVGTVGTVEIQIPDTYNATYLIVSSNSSLTSPTEYALTDNGDGTYSTTVDLSDGEFFTFGAGASPGRLAANLELWLKGDAGITESSNNVSAWADQSGNSYNFTDVGTSAYTYDADGLNYNPEVVNSDGSDRRLANTNSISLQTVFLVTDPDSPDASDNPFSEVGADDEGIRIDATTTTNWDVPGSSSDFTDATGQGWLNGTSGTDPAHGNNPNILVVEAPASATIAGGIELGDTESSRYWHGSIAEIIGYNSTLSSTERQKIESYLAIKYGITASNDYLASDATSLWNATTNASYHNDVFGIGRDDGTVLNHKQSTASIMTVALGSLAADNASNANTFSTDLALLVLGHDNAGFTETTSTLSSSSVFLLGRKWLAAETNESGTLEVRFDLTSLTITGTTASDFQLVLDTDTDPSNGTRATVAAASYSSNIVTFSSVDIEDGDYIMLVTGQTSGKTDPPLTDGQAADGVLGQPDFDASTTNNGGISASRLNKPTSIAVGPTGKVFVSDTGNHRILRWSSANAITDGSAAEAVLGQADFTSGNANRGSTVAANTLYEPTGIYVTSGGALYVSDSNNHRILRFDNAESASDGADADGVLGQGDFTSRDPNRRTNPTASTLRWPKDVFVDASGNLWVADNLNHRVLRYDNVAAKSNGGSADGVLGQEDFTTRLRIWKTNTDADSFVYPSGVHVTNDTLWVADSGNSRILKFADASTKADGSDADGVLGQDDFTSWKTNQGGFPAANTLQWPDAGITMDNNSRLWVADRWADRVIWYHLASDKANGANADGIIGQSSFTSRHGVVDNDSFNSVTDVYVDTDNDYVWVVDHNHSRILRFDGDGSAIGKTSGTIAPVTDALDLWLKADDGVFADREATKKPRTTDNIYVWLDQSQRGYAALANAAPIFIEEAVNGYPAVHFDASEASMSIHGGIFGNTTFKDATAWAVLRPLPSRSQAGADFELLSSDALYSTYIPAQDAINEQDASTESRPNQSHDFVLGQEVFTQGTLAELLVSFGSISGHHNATISSYLAIKYGVPLGQSYLNTAGDTLWNIQTLPRYNHGMAGIGRDDAMGLMQTTSKALGDAHILTFSTHNPGQPASSFAHDLTHVVWGHNNEGLAIDLETSHTGASYRMRRTWLVRSTQGVDTVSVQIPAASRADYLLVDDQDTFRNPQIIPLHFAGSDYLFARVPLAQTRYLTFAAREPQAGYNAIPLSYALHQNYPNPFNTATRIGIEVPETGRVRIEVFDILGRRVRVPLDTEMPAGRHTIAFDGTGLASGVYFYRMQTGEKTRTKKMLVAK